MEKDREREITGTDERPAQRPPTGRPQRPEDALVDAALDCVRWDESVDLDRLMLLEFEHNTRLLLPAVAGTPRPVSQTLDCLVTSAAVDARSDMEEDWLFAYGYKRLKDAQLKCTADGVWTLNGGEPMTDSQLIGLLTICARHTSFWFGFGFACTWLARVVEALARRTRAWTGSEVMRARNLCIALEALAEARRKDGPLAIVDLSKSGPFDQGAVAAAAATTPLCRAVDCERDLAEPMRVALARTTRLFDQAGIGFRVHRPLRVPNAIDAYDHTRHLLTVVRAGIERLYATETFYLGVITPAEYKAMADNTPLGAALFN
ncbi:hypothetical protein pdul_cds_896 [Pandoravirus dulcis]|uniref:Uncharacterized protein n=1 Tax=Pandoravirus dulcis TaxID=1349409 RepID=S4VYI0_9VIRU|nr:hypothetical protein pdul_cds_896 [Pandoravirus dulcis]AGO83126.1 hypothetical protein pdul_cds_896 [Pandoravirus dulcis]